MAEISEEQWKDAMTKVFDKLDDEQYKRMLGILQKCDFSSPQKKTAKFKRELPQRIIEKYGLDESISIISTAMKKIPRNDPSVQNLLRPFVDKLERKDKENPRAEGKSSTPEQTGPAGAAKPEEKTTGSTENPRLKPSHKSGSEIPALAIQDLKTTGVLGQNFTAGKVVNKSGLRTYQTRNGVVKPYFNLGVADKTDCIKVMVYGQERFQGIKEGSFYTFRDVIMDNNVMKITKMSKVSETAAFDVPKSLEVEALKLISSPGSSIASLHDRKLDKMGVSVEGTVKEIGCCKPIEMRNKQMKDKLDFKLEDETGFIRISLWGQDTEHIHGTSVGDVVTVFNVKTNLYGNTVSLNSTDSTRIIKVQSAAAHNVAIQIVGIIKAGEVETELEALVNNQPQTLAVASSLLTNMFAHTLEGNLQDKLVEKIPFWAEAEIQGNKINQMKVAPL